MTTINDLDAMPSPISGLTAAQYERLLLVSNSAANIQKAILPILLHGRLAHSSPLRKSANNEQLLAEAINEFLATILLLDHDIDLDLGEDPVTLIEQIISVSHYQEKPTPVKEGKCA